MTNQPAEPSAETETPGRAWRPSRTPDYHVERSSQVTGSRIVERSHSRGVIRAVLRFLRNPAVRVVIGVALFIAAAIVFDATVNDSSWTERAPKPKATAHGARR
jgi:hypothetical protein